MHTRTAALLLGLLPAPTRGFGRLADEASLPTSVWPEAHREAEVCGTTWQHTYASLHHAAIQPGGSGRVIVFDAHGGAGGYADRLIGLMSTLLLGILTDRALAIDWPGYDEALETPHLDVALALKRSWETWDGEVPTKKTEVWFNHNRLKIQEAIEGQPLDELWGEQVLFVQSNRGFTDHLLRSEHGAAAAAKRGLNATTGQFGCLFNFLLRPNQQTLAPLVHLRSALADPNYVTVGVHVRVGDTAFTPDGRQVLASFEKTRQAANGAMLHTTHRFIFAYADALVANLSEATGRKPRLLLLGDSADLRRHASTLYDADAFVTSDLTVTHVARKVGDAPALRAAVGEHWVYSGAAAFVYSAHSGYPRTAAARAMRDDVIHTCFHYLGATFSEKEKGKPRPSRECTGPWSVEKIANRHAAGM